MKRLDDIIYIEFIKRWDNKMGSIKEVAKHAGVSVATVSYVINNNKYVSPELTKKVMDSIEILDYNTNPVARSLRNKKTGIIGVVLQNIRNAFFPQLLGGLEEYAKEHNYSLSFFNTYNDIKTEKKDIETLRNMWVDAIILDSCIEEDKKTEYIKYLNSNKTGKKIPIVLLERNLGAKNINAVVVDNLMGGYEATKHLIDRGSNKIVHIAGLKSWSMTYDRMQGYLKALEENNLSGTAVVKYGNLRPQDGYEVMKELLIHDSTINGVFAANDQMALGAIKAIKEFGMSIPDDISVVGFDNIFVSTMVEPSLTTVNVPKYLMGSTAAKLAIQAIENPEKEPETITLSTNLIVRQSTDLRGEKNWELYGW